LASKKTGRDFASYDELHEWSVIAETAGDFWMMLFEFLDMGASVPPAKAFEPVGIWTHLRNFDVFAD